MPEKSSIGEISSKISSRPDFVETSVRPSACGLLDSALPVVVADEPVEAVGLEGQQVGNLERFRDLGERHATGVDALMLMGRCELLLLALREAAKSGPSEARGLESATRMPGTTKHTRSGVECGQEAAQRSRLPSRTDCISNQGGSEAEARRPSGIALVQRSELPQSMPRSVGRSQANTRNLWNLIRLNT